jgi:hypothetical protein
MQGKTHARGGEVAAMTGYFILSTRGSLHSNLVPDIVSFAIIYPFAIWGSKLPDQDHNYHAIPCRDTVSMGFYYLLHATKKLRDSMPQKSGYLYDTLGIFDAKHRSWQTHSFEVMILLIFITGLFSNPNAFSGMSPVSLIILQLVFTGISLGWLSHIILDWLTPDGINCVTFQLINWSLGKHVLPDKIKICPQSHYFATGNGWELGSKYFPGIRMILNVIAMVLFVILLLDWLGILSPLMGLLV